MKKIDILCIAAMLVSAAACTEELKTEVLVAPSQDGRITINATIADNPGTKLTMDSSNGKLYWERGDRIGIFTESSGNNGSWFRYDGEDYVHTAVFSGTLEPAPEAGEYIYGIHPYFDPFGAFGTGIHEGKASVFLTNGYQSARGFAGEMLTGYKGIPGMLPEYGDSFPMVARSKDNNLHFYNVCGGLTVTVNTPGLIGVIIKNNDGSPIWGFMDVSFDADDKPVVESISMPDGYYQASGESKEDVSLDEVWVMDDGTDYDYFLAPGEPYYVVLPPVTFTQGMTVTYRTPCTSATYEVSGPFDIKRNVFSRLTNRDAALEFKPLEGNITFSCEALKQYLVQHYDTNGDGEISYAEALDVKQIVVNNAGGLGNPTRGYDMMYFENLETFVWRGTADNPGDIYRLQTYWWPKLKYLDCRNNSIQNSVDFYSNVDIETIILQVNQISRIGLGNLPKLTTLALSYNNISSIDLSGCPNLEELYLANNSSALRSLDLSSTPNLTFLNCAGNGIESLDVSCCTKLNYFACPSNSMRTLVLGELPDLEVLYCYYNKLEQLDLSGCPALYLLSCYQNKLPNLDLSSNKKLAAAYVSYNPLGTIDVSKNTALEVLFCCMNGLSTIDVSENASLTSLRCFGNTLNTLDLSHNPLLSELWCGDNPMTELDVSNNPQLERFNAAYAENWQSEWESYVIRSTTYTSPLRYLYIADGQVIPDVTQDRLDSAIPYVTIVTTRNASGHPHADVLGTYTMKASTDGSTDTQGNYVRHNLKWEVNATEYEGDETRVWLEPMCFLAYYYPVYFRPEGGIYAIVRGDGQGFRIPLPQKTGILNENIFSYTGGYMYYYTWEDDISSTGGYHFKTDDDIVEFSARTDGSMIANKAFGMAIDRVTYSMYPEPVYYGMVNYLDNAYPISLTKNDGGNPQSVQRRSLSRRSDDQHGHSTPEGLASTGMALEDTCLHP